MLFSKTCNKWVDGHARLLFMVRLTVLKKAKVLIWLYDNIELRIEGFIIVSEAAWLFQVCCLKRASSIGLRRVHECCGR